MTLTPFAGLEILAPGAPLSTDSWRFQSIDPSLIDFFLEIGAQTHRHDELPGLVNPNTEVELTQEPTGGALPPDTTVYACFTKVDALGGETLSSKPVSIKTAAGFANPANAPTLTPNLTAGNLLASNYAYAVTVIDGEGGETALGPPSTYTLATGYAHAEIDVEGLKAIMEEVSGTGWRLWRSLNGGPWDLIAKGTAATFLDNGEEEVDCNVSPPESSTIKGKALIQVVVAEPSETPAATNWKLYLSTSSSFTSPSYVATYPLSEYGKTLTFTELPLLPGEPPKVSSSVKHANKIDPDKDLVEWHWKRPVLNLAALEALSGENAPEEFDIRVTEEEREIWIYKSGTWESLKTASGGRAKSEEGLGFAVKGLIGAGLVPGKYIHLATGEKQYLTGVIGELITKGKVKLSVYHNGVVVAGLKELTLVHGTPYEHFLGTPIELADKDYIDIFIESVEEEPEGLRFTPFVLHNAEVS